MRIRKVIELTQGPRVTKRLNLDSYQGLLTPDSVPFLTYSIVSHQMLASFEDSFQHYTTINYNNAFEFSLWDCAKDFYFQRGGTNSPRSTGWGDIQPLEKEKELSGIIVRWNMTDPHKLVEVWWISCVQVYWRTCHSHIGLWGRGMLI